MKGSDLGNAIVGGMFLAAGMLAVASFAIGAAVVGLVWWLT